MIWLATQILGALLGALVLGGIAGWCLHIWLRPEAPSAEFDSTMLDPDAGPPDQRMLIRERNRLVAERDRLVAERNRTAAEREGLRQERDALSTERDALADELHASQTHIARLESALGLHAPPTEEA